MSLRSPWQSRFFSAGVNVLRRVLRPLPGLEDAFIRRLVTAQNRRVSRHIESNPTRFNSVLLILPRCLKRTGCRLEIRPAGEIADGRESSSHQPLADCPDCDLCALGEIARLTQQYGVRAFVAFRSHIAFALARREKPDLIIATACNDRLIKALYSVPEIPAVLAPLTGMEKPCVNASCDLVWLEEQLRHAAGAGHPREAPEPVHPVDSSAAEKRVTSAEGM